MHGIRAQESQDAYKEKPPMPAEKWPNVLEEFGDGIPPKPKGNVIEDAFCNAMSEFARVSWKALTPPGPIA